ncbi:MAG TPA: hypothetical protein VJ302_33055 [Blastocatellia bacterium]|nr:hypothetical protein [Blastocatellia bacterium]
MTAELKPITGMRESIAGLSGTTAEYSYMWNGFGERMTTIFLPNPRLSDEMKVLKEPQWERPRL